MDNSTSEILTSKTYTYYLNGVEKSITVEPNKWDLYSGGISISYDSDGMISKMTNIGALHAHNITQIQIRSYGRTYIVVDDVQTYFYEKGEYHQLCAGAVTDLEKYDLTAYYDSVRIAGGLICVLIVREN